MGSSPRRWAGTWVMGLIAIFKVMRLCTVSGVKGRASIVMSMMTPKTANTCQ